MNVAYIRVSTVEQNEARQIEALQQYNIERWFTEKVSAKDTNRPRLREMLEFVREGDVVYVLEFSRLSRGTKDLLEITEEFKRKGVSLVSIKENLDTSTPTGKLMLTMVAAINEFERTNLLERQREGIAIAKRNGVYTGSVPFEKRKGFSEKLFEQLYEKYLLRQISKSEFARQLGTSRPTLDRLLRERQGKTDREI